MDIATIKTELDYRLALETVENLMNAKLNSPKGERLEALVAQMEAWEREHHSGAPTPFVPRKPVIRHPEVRGR